MTETYPIPAREVVPGMLVDGYVVKRVYGGFSPPRPVITGDFECAIWLDGADYALQVRLDDSVAVTLSGPSPRELCPDLADKLRRWPAPLDGHSWRQFEYTSKCGWLCDLPDGRSAGGCVAVFAFEIGDRAIDSEYSTCSHEQLVECFFLPAVTP